MQRDTIFALASANGKSGIAVYRVSGPEADTVLRRFCDDRLPEPRKAVWRRFRDVDGNEIDDGLVIRFSDGASFTGEQSVEFHGHGGSASVRAMMSALSAVPGVRLAEPGEFSRRAFLNGRFSLVEADALADLINAETELQRVHALMRKSGGFRNLAESWRSRVIETRALLELTIDWVDEDVPGSVDHDVYMNLLATRSEMIAELAKGRRSSRLDKGFEVALVGSQNVGKSSLVNYLTQRQSSIVSAIPGTTRDVIEAPLDFDGVPVRLLDMAGIRETNDPIEKIGVDLAISRAREADLRVFLTEPGLEETDLEGLRTESDLVAMTKSDLHGPVGRLFVSSITGEGVELLVEEIRKRLPNTIDTVGSLGTERELELTDSCISLLDEVLCDGVAVEVQCQILLSVQSRLDELLGYSGIEAVFDSVFGRFCLGK